jgi:hypothetical protein
MLVRGPGRDSVEITGGEAAVVRLRGGNTDSVHGYFPRVAAQVVMFCRPRRPARPAVQPRTHPVQRAPACPKKGEKPRARQSRLLELLARRTPSARLADTETV